MNKIFIIAGILFLVWNYEPVPQIFAKEFRPDPIDTSLFIEVNGLKQYLEIKSESK